MAAFETKTTPSMIKGKENKKAFFRSLDNQRNIVVKEIKNMKDNAETVFKGSLVECRSYISRNTMHNKQRVLLLE